MTLKTKRIIKKNLQKIILNIKKHSPHPQKVQIIAVTKTLTNEAITSAINNNIFNIGESKVQETQTKLQNYQKPEKLKIHMIGHLQTNKTKEAVKLYDVIETVDTLKLAQAINKAAKTNQKQQSVYIQVNITNNKNQYGVHPNQLTKLLLETQELKNIKVLGLMAIGAHTKNIQKTKNTYKQLQLIKNKTQKETQITFQETSLGMSNDYIYALEAGATEIRIGTKLFGERN